MDFLSQLAIITDSEHNNNTKLVVSIEYWGKGTNQEKKHTHKLWTLVEIRDIENVEQFYSNIIP